MTPWEEKRRHLLAGVAASLTVLVVVLVILFTFPLVATERPAVEWTGGKAYAGNGGFWAEFDLGWPTSPGQPLGYAFCTPPNASGLTISLTWQASRNNTTARAWWSTNQYSINLVYSASNSSQGGYSIPPALMAFLCSTEQPLTFQWQAGNSSVFVRYAVLREFNYTALQPVW